MFYSQANVKRLLNNSSEEDQTISEEHLKMIRKRHALFLVTIQTMILYHQSQMLDHKVSALHKRVLQIKKERTKNNENETTSE